MKCFLPQRAAEQIIKQTMEMKEKRDRDSDRDRDRAQVRVRDAIR